MGDPAARRALEAWRTETMGMEAPTLDRPKIPDPAIVAEVIRMADAAEAERYDQRPPTWPTYRVDDPERYFRPTPAADALLAFLRGLPDTAVAALYGAYKLGDPPRPTPAEAAERYRYSYELAMLPMHRKYGAGDLAGKGPLAHGLRRGIERLGLRLEDDTDDASTHNVPDPP